MTPRGQQQQSLVAAPFFILMCCLYVQIYFMFRHKMNFQTYGSHTWFRHMGQTYGDV